METGQSTESGGKPRITETANFDFRNDEVGRSRWREMSSTNTGSSCSRGWLEEQRSFSRSEDRNNQVSRNMYCWKDTKTHSSWLEDGIDGVKKMEKEGRAMNIYNSQT